MIVLGAVYLLSRNRLLRAALLALTASRLYPGVHWASDVVGGALLGTAALLWAFGGRGWGPGSAAPRSALPSPRTPLLLPTTRTEASKSPVLRMGLRAKASPRSSPPASS